MVFRLVLLALLLSSRASAQPAPAPQPSVSRPALSQLTRRGRFMLAASGSGLWSAEAPSVLLPSRAGLFVGSASLNYFVRDRLGVGLTFGAGLGGAPKTQAGPIQFARSEHELGTSARLLFDLPLSSGVSLFFDGGLGWAYSKVQQTGSAPRFGNAEGPPGTSPSASAFGTVNLGWDRAAHYARLSLKVPVVFRFSRHVALGVGPELNIDALLVAHGPSTRALLDAGAHQCSDGYFSAEGSCQANDGPPKQRARLQAGAVATLYCSF